MRGKELLTPDQRNMFMSIPDDIAESDIERHYTFTPEDLAFINKHRRDHNRLGIALQLAVLRYPGWTLFQIKDIPSQILDYIAKQIDVSPQEYTQYAKRVATRNEHLEELRQHYGYKNLSFSLYQLIPRVKLTDLLMEVASWTGFDKQFLHASTLHPPKEEDKPAIMAAIMAMGTNIGLTKMAEATQGVSYRQMSTASQWRLYEDAMNKAQAVLVNFQHQLSLSSYWGDGTTSSSDGMRVQVGVSSLHADANPHYGTGKGATIYRF